ncbi:hypothetical protein GobsT_60750 [Gemmata obscuriglobus]|uniref:TIGR02996 domain-containing protein n=1 Tax=Gemmata obscuriglobus TaxID=114 RepID=A0A2Z3GZ72_9BACT|nr:TIGR02996 domain-containing protein [Gemmata obscuriglobus]AWM36155.1 TIGR02996 domain-containing protein [Gemmata obscuriglobus]QEG31254.1 hypothetical protein GobsT_60750 [Gemmata obscuriglobus]VTS10592.1 Repeat-companion domain TIGR02996 OS=Singulisphaera acidiphila (strain ATCC BAA-1392 / DSM 18658 / VKM B-2454 / MOB10) GN=Sinac_4455 PE=4 SV=1: LRR_6: LRR_6 [Gemmata obscuriglobus UQM 2246]
MSDEKALLDAIWEHPHDDTVRLAYADWLDEHEQPARAEFIRVQIGAARLNRWDEPYPALVKREDELLVKHEAEWRAKVPKKWVKSQFHRGFLQLNVSGLSFETLTKLTVRQLKLAPLARYHYNLRARDYNAFLEWPGAVFQDLFAPRPPLPDGWLDRLLVCDRLRNASEVAFICDPRAVLTADEVRGVLDTWANRHLVAFRFASEARTGAAEDADTAAYEVMAGHRALANVRRLDLHSTRPGPVGLHALGHSPHLDNLRELELSGAHVGDAELTELCRSPLLPSLRELWLTGCEVGDEGAVALANSPAASGLRVLSVFRNNIGPDGLRALARSPHLTGLRRLELAQNPGGRYAEVNAELQARFGHMSRFRV